MNDLDKLVQAQFPLVPVARFGAFEPLALSGERYLVGSNGIALEISRPWMHAIFTLTESPLKELPYGKLPESGVTLRCGPIPKRLFTAFCERARAACPKEIGAWIVWNERTREFREIELPARSHSEVHLTYECPELEPGEWKVLDVHSHGRYPAFFSSVDEQDDQGALQVAMVVGQCDSQDMSVVSRFETLGLKATSFQLRLEHEANAEECA